MKNLIKKPRNLFNMVSATVYFYLFSFFTGIQVFAEGEGGLASSKLVTGTTKLINDISTVLMGIITIVGAVVILFFSIRMAITSEDHEKSKYKKSIIATIVCVVIGLSASGIVALISAYYK